MSTSKSMTTYSQVLNLLPERGYGKELTIKRAGASFDGSETILQPGQLKIVKVYRFEGESDPGDMAVIYLLHGDSGEKGFILNAYGTYSDEDNQYYDEFIKRVPIEEIEEMGSNFE
ncbi:MAG: hypothetical protein ABJJ26_14505 [Algoriphagus sp.]|uniref:hypothetical protein n=1 Tax=Algoriphagus sp. TaxID=1872435 RepID=UPI0032982F08